MFALMATAYWLPAALIFLVLRRLTRPRTTRGRVLVTIAALGWPILALLVIIGR